MAHYELASKIIVLSVADNWDEAIQAPRERYALIDYEGLRGLLGFGSMNDVAEAYRGWINESVKEMSHSRDGEWTESVAVGSESFVVAIKEKLGFTARGRKVVGGSGAYEMRESPASYNGVFDQRNEVLRYQNAYFWENTV